MHLSRNQTSASEIRPFKLITAFQNLGYDVDVVEGYGKDRKQQIATIKEKIRNSQHYDFLYSESSTMPTLLTESHHFPTYPCLDFSFFAFCKKHNIPVGLFYRDIHWCFVNKNRDWKQRIARLFYRYDLWKYNNLLDVLFLPSKEMLPHIPIHFKGKVTELPPGCEIHNETHYETRDCINLLYVGGVGGNYDLLPLLKAVAQCPFVRLTICCRPDDWENIRGKYAGMMPKNAIVVHKSPEDLPPYYANSDLFAIFFSGGYWDFSVPFKLFEAIGFGIPLIAAEGAWCGKFVRENGIGCTVPWDAEALTAELANIHRDKRILLDLRQRTKALSPQHTWENRCRLIAETLTKKNSK